MAIKRQVAYKTMNKGLKSEDNPINIKIGG